MLAETLWKRRGLPCCTDVETCVHVVNPRLLAAEVFWTPESRRASPWPGTLLGVRPRVSIKARLTDVAAE